MCCVGERGSITEYLVIFHLLEPYMSGGRAAFGDDSDGLTARDEFLLTSPFQTPYQADKVRVEISATGTTEVTINELEILGWAESRSSCHSTAYFVVYIVYSSILVR